LKYEPGIIREEFAKLVRQNESSQLRAQFPGHFAMDSTGRIHVDQCPFYENIWRVRTELVQIVGGNKSGGDHGTVLCLLDGESWGDAHQS
jgi:hypothetical protein